jgi:hypothetical protein
MNGTATATYPARWTRKLTDWTPEKVLAMLETSDVWVERAIVRLHSYQTTLERQAQCTTDKNEQGMQQADAKLFSKYAEKILRGEHLSRWELIEARRPWHRGRVPVIRIGKYRKQLVRIIEADALRRENA